MIMVAGIDGGGTKTTVEVCGQNGELVKRKTFGAFNLNSIGEAAFEQLLGEIFDFIKACGEVHTVCIGAAGISNPSVQMLTEKVKKEKKFPGELLLRGDHEIALYGAVRDAAGCILIAGTGSICLGKKNSNSEEKLIRAGGWGHLIDDGGSGYSLGRDALNAVVQSYDKRKNATILTSLILEHWNCRDVAELVAEVYQNQEKSHIASLAQLVECAGRMEDEAALHILKKNAMQLAELVKDVAGQLRGDTEEIPLFLFGGLLINDTLLRQFLLEILEKEAGFLKRRVPISDAVGGAVYLALEHLKRQM